MEKLKIELPSELIIVLLFILSIINTIININLMPPSQYSENNYKTSGIITQCQNNQLTLNSKEKLIVNYKNFKCEIGDKVKIKGKFIKPKQNTIFNQFNYQKYLLSKKIKYIVDASSIEIIKKNTNILYNVKQKLEKYISKYKSKNYLQTFILGLNKDIDEEIMKSYQNNGISHLLAISGMHITILSAILLYILNKISKNIKRNYFLIIIFLIFYMFITNFTPSVVRATLMFIILTIKKTFNLKIKTIYILLLICALYLFYNPYIIYNIGFLYSFIITFYLILFSKLISNKKSYILKTVTVSFIAFLASLPITINNFHSINILSPLINTFFVPLVSIIIYPLSLIALLIKPLDNILYFLIQMMENLSLIFNNLNYLLTLKHMNMLFVIFYFFLITYTLHKLQNKQLNGLFLLIIVVTFHHNINYFDNNAYLTMIDVGQGDSLLIKLNNNKGNILIDTGGIQTYNGQKPYDIANKKIIPYLKSEGITKLDYLILTHGDYDHAGMALNLLNNFKINNVILNNNQDTEVEKQIIKYLMKNRLNFNKINKKPLKINDIKFHFLISDKSLDENNDSLIIYTKIKSQNILLMGDAEKEREKIILNEYNLPKMDILKVGHHGSKTSTSPEFIKKLGLK